MSENFRQPDGPAFALDRAGPDTQSPTLGDFIVDVVNTWDASETPAELRAACLDLSRHTRAEQTQMLRAVLLLTIGLWARDLEAGGNDPAAIEQVAASEALTAVAMFMRERKAQRGETIRPARTAIFAYHIAHTIAAAKDFKLNMADVIAAYEADLAESCAAAPGDA